MTDNRLRWISAGANGETFREATQRRPGWYWILRPHHAGPGQYKAERPIMCPVHVFEGGRISSPLADFRDGSAAQVSPRNAKGRVFASMFAGPLLPGETSGHLIVHPKDTTYTVDGEVPALPGWYWCRTNTEAPLLHVDNAGIGPVYLDRLEDAVHVWSATTLDGQAVDVGELGFSEPLVSAGGIIDESGELGRREAFFHGRISVPEPPSFPLWTDEPLPETRSLTLSSGQVTLRVADLARARSFYEKLGFVVMSTRPEEGWARLSGGDLQLYLVTGRGSALHFKAGANTPTALAGLGIQPEATSEGFIVTDPDGHRIVFDTSDGGPESSIPPQDSGD